MVVTLCVTNTVTAEQTCDFANIQLLQQGEPLKAAIFETSAYGLPIENISLRFQHSGMVDDV